MQLFFCFDMLPGWDVVSPSGFKHSQHIPSNPVPQHAHFVRSPPTLVARSFLLPGHRSTVTLGALRSNLTIESRRSYVHSAGVDELRERLLAELEGKEELSRVRERSRNRGAGGWLPAAPVVA